MDASRPPSEPELAGLDEEQLLALGRQENRAEAVNELILRCREQAQRFIAVCANHFNLSLPDREDAQANSVFAIREAIDKFDPQKAKGQIKHSFRRFLFQVLHARFLDFVKHQQRGDRHFHPIHGGYRGQGSHLAALQLNVWCTGRSMPDPNDPAKIAQENELRGRIEKALKLLGPEERELCKHKMAGQSLDDFALRNNIPLPQVKRLWTKIKTRLHVELADMWNGTK